MKAFLEQYGTAIFALVVVAILVVFAEPVGSTIKDNIKQQVNRINDLGDETIDNVDAMDYVYAY